MCVRMASQICAKEGVLGNLLLHRGWEVFPEVIPREKAVEWSKRIDGLVSECETPLKSLHGNARLPSLVHCETAWEVRCATLTFFAWLFHTDEHEVVLSADGLAVGSPSAHKREARYGKKDIEGLPYWLHIDCDRRTLLGADHVDEIQGYLCLRGGDYEGAHSTCLCSPKRGQSIAVTKFSRLKFNIPTQQQAKKARSIHCSKPTS